MRDGLTACSPACVAQLATAFPPPRVYLPQLEFGGQHAALLCVPK